jgi:ribonuclease HI
MITAYIDGGSRGNPGPAGYGVQIVADDGVVVAELREFVGQTTNNVAEYRGLLAALGWAVDRGLDALHVRSDSELLVKQLRGEYRVKNPGLQPLYQDAWPWTRHLRQRKRVELPIRSDSARDDFPSTLVAPPASSRSVRAAVSPDC